MITPSEEHLDAIQRSEDYEFTKYVCDLWCKPNKRFRANAISAFRFSTMKASDFRRIAKDIGKFDESMETFLYEVET